jgi:hypothetical protein
MKEYNLMIEVVVHCVVPKREGTRCLADVTSTSLEIPDYLP